MTQYHKIETMYERGADFKVDPTKIKNPIYGELKRWFFTEKIDGTNIRCIWKDKVLSFNGKTDNAQVPGDLIKWLYENVNSEKMLEVFPDVDAVIYGEGYGAGIQKGGGDYSPTKKIIVFDVLVGNVGEPRKWWLNQTAVNDVTGKLGLDVVPFLGEMSLEEATEMVRKGFKSFLNGGIKDAEGLVGRPLETLFDKKGSRLILKLKTKDF